MKTRNTPVIFLPDAKSWNWYFLDYHGLFLLRFARLQAIESARPKIRQSQCLRQSGGRNTPGIEMFLLFNDGMINFLSVISSRPESVNVSFLLTINLRCFIFKMSISQTPHLALPKETAAEIKALFIFSKRAWRHSLWVHICCFLAFCGATVHPVSSILWA